MQKTYLYTRAPFPKGIVSLCGSCGENIFPPLKDYHAHVKECMIIPTLYV